MSGRVLQYVQKESEAQVDGEGSLWGPGGRIKGLSGAEGDLTCTYRKCKTSLVHTESAKLDAEDEDVEL